MAISQPSLEPCRLRHRVPGHQRLDGQQVQLPQAGISVFFPDRAEHFK